MGQMTRPEIIATLAKDNPLAKPGLMAIFADAFLAYCEATRNITQYGVIVAHPRTGQPMQNPYVPIQSGARKALTESRLKSDQLWDRFADELETLPRTAPASITPTQGADVETDHG